MLSTKTYLGVVARSVFALRAAAWIVNLAECAMKRRAVPR